VSARPLPNEPDGTLKLEDIIDSIRPTNVHFPFTRLVALENTQNYCGGRLLPDRYIQDVAAALQGKDIKLHLDGARIWNAAVAAGKSVADLVVGVDSMSVCMSKGLGAPVGSLLVGPAAFIDKARYIRKSLGGGMRQAGVLAAACLVALDDFEAGVMIPQDHRHAQLIAEAIAEDSVSAFHVDISKVDSNIIVVHLAEACPLVVDEVVLMLKAQGVLVAARDTKSIRIVTHRDLSHELVDQIINGFRNVSESIMLPSS
jgi:threonine aldolase